jgi:hypothetical protein
MPRLKRKTLKFNYEFKTYWTMSALHSLAQHFVENEKLIEEAADKEVEMHGPKWTPNTDDQDELGEFFALRDLARMMHDDIMIPTHHNSCVVMLYSTVERELRRLIENLEKKHGPQRIKLDDLRGGSYLAQVKKYTDVFYGLRLAECPQYEALIDLQKIRDCIVHCLGEVRFSRDKEYLVKLRDKRKGFFAHPDNDLYIYSECIVQFFFETWDFFFWIFTKLKWKIDKHYQGPKLQALFAKLKSKNA